MAKELRAEFEEELKLAGRKLLDAEKKLRENENACILCGGEKLLFEPLVLYCSGTCNTRVRRMAYYYSTAGAAAAPSGAARGGVCSTRTGARACQSFSASSSTPASSALVPTPGIPEGPRSHNGPPSWPKSAPGHPGATRPAAPAHFSLPNSAPGHPARLLSPSAAAYEY